MPEFIMHRSQIDRIQIFVVRKRSILTDLMFLRRQLRSPVDDFLTDFLIGNDFIGNFDCNIITDRFPLIREVGMIENNNDNNADQEVKNHGKTIAETAQYTSHFLFMRSSSGCGRTGADPACPVQNAVEQSHDQCEQVEIPQSRHVVRIEETFSGNTVSENRCNLPEPGKVAENKHRKNRKDRIGKKGLQSIGDNESHRSAAPDDEESQSQHTNDDKTECGNLYSEKFKFMR